MNLNQRFLADAAPWLEAFGEVELIGGWAEVVLDEAFATRVECPGYQVFLTSYDPVQLFVQNRVARSFEIHALPGPVGRGRGAARCGYRVVGRLVEPKERGAGG